MICCLGKCRLILTLKRKTQPPGTLLVVQWLGPQDLTAKGLGSIPGQGTTISRSHKTKKQNKDAPNSSFLSQKYSSLLPPSRLLETSCTTGTWTQPSSPQTALISSIWQPEVRSVPTRGETWDQWPRSCSMQPPTSSSKEKTSTSPPWTTIYQRRIRSSGERGHYLWRSLQGAGQE